jgi:predicted  nucleic acid-binding Zn-ribbon protein
MQLKCGKCGHEWDYTGESDHWCSCPRCRTNVKVHQDPENRPDPGQGQEPTEPPDAPPAEVAELAERVDRLDAQVESIGETLGNDFVQVTDDVAELEERVRSIETATGEIGETIEALWEHWGGESPWESDLLTDPDQDAGASTGIPEAVQSAGIYDPTEEDL